MFNMFNMSCDFFDSINLITFVSFLNFLVSRIFFIMSKCCFDHFSLTQFIFAENVQMLFSCNHCTQQKKFYIISDKFNKYSEYVHLKKSCSLFSDFLIMNVTQLFKTCEKIEKEQIAFFNKKQYLFEAFQAAETKKH